MGIGSGIGAQVGVAVESAYGTFVSPATFIEVQKNDLKKVKNIVQGGGVAAGRMTQLGSRRRVTTVGAAGGIDMEVPNKGFGKILNTLMGGTVVPVQQAASTAYLQTHTLTDTIGKSLTIQSGLPTMDGTVRCFTYPGCKFNSIEFACSVDQLLTASIDIDARTLDETQTLAAASYPTTIAPFHFGQMNVKVGAAYGSEVAVAVRSASCKIERMLRTDRFYTGNAGLKAEPVINDFAQITGSLDVDFIDKTVFNDRFSADTPFSLVIEFVGANIASTYYETFRIKLPDCFLDGDTPTLDSQDIITGTFNYDAQYDGVNSPVIIEYMSTDTTL